MSRYFRDTEVERSRPSLRRITAPEVMPVTAEAARLHLRIDHEDDDELLDTYLQAATDMLDGAEGRLGRAIVRQTWEQRQPGIVGRVELMLGPECQLVALSYIDRNDDERALVPEAYRVIDMGDRAYIEPRNGFSWPGDFGDRPDALRVTFTAGQAVGDVPETIRQAIRLLAGHYYEQREATAVVEMKEIPIGAETLINLNKVKGWAG